MEDLKKEMQGLCRSINCLKAFILLWNLKTEFSNHVLILERDLGEDMHIRFSGSNRIWVFIQDIREMARKAVKMFKGLERKQQTGLVLASVFLAGLICIISFYFQIDKPSHLFADFPHEPDASEFKGPAWNAQDYFDQNIVNVVLLGFDKDGMREEGASVFRTDTIKVASINFDKEKVSIVNIPRDTYIKIADTNILDKINHSYFFGYRYSKQDDRHEAGIEYTLKSVSNVLGGIPLHYYVAIDMDGVIQLVDAIGGVEFYVEKNIYNNLGTLWVREGQQVLTGRRYLYYMRSRENGGDLGRAKRQTELLKATLEHFKKQGIFKQVPALYGTYQTAVDTNLTSKQIISLVLYSRNFSGDDILSYTLSGFDQMKDGIYYMGMDQLKRAEIIRTVFGINFEPLPQETLMDTTPAPPRAFSSDYLLNEEGKRGVLLTWEPGDKFNRTYNLFRETGEGLEELLAEGIEAELYWDMSVENDQEYVYRLEAVNRRVVSTSVFVEITILDTYPAKPRDFIHTLIQNGVVLTWRAGDSTTQGFRLTRKSEQDPGVVLMDGNKLLSYKDEGLPEGEYHYTLVAVNAQGFHSVAATIVVKIQRDDNPGEPSDPGDDPDEPDEND